MEIYFNRIQLIGLILIQKLGEPNLCKLILFFLKEQEEKDALDYHSQMWENIAGKYYQSVDKLRRCHLKVSPDYIYYETNIPCPARKRMLTLITYEKELRKMKDKEAKKYLERVKKLYKDGY